jgi:hypothetical protein
MYLDALYVIYPLPSPDRKSFRKGISKEGADQRQMHQPLELRDDLADHIHVCIEASAEEHIANS